MHFPLILTVLATAQASTLLPRDCYDSQGSWPWRKGGNAQLASDTVDRICNNASTSGTVSGTFTGKQTKAWCEPGNLYSALDDVGSATYMMFSVQWTKDYAPPFGPLNDEDCKLRLKNEINGCGWGGKTTTADWTFK
jgi:hypothetical protein